MAQRKRNWSVETENIPQITNSVKLCDEGSYCKQTRCVFLKVGTNILTLIR
jgi:hypothetical protein